MFLSCPLGKEMLSTAPPGVYSFGMQSYASGCLHPQVGFKSGTETLCVIHTVILCTIFFEVIVENQRWLFWTKVFFWGRVAPEEKYQGTAGCWVLKTSPTENCHNIMGKMSLINLLKIDQSKMIILLFILSARIDSSTPKSWTTSVKSKVILIVESIVKMINLKCKSLISGMQLKLLAIKAPVCCTWTSIWNC